MNTQKLQVCVVLIRCLLINFVQFCLALLAAGGLTEACDHVLTGKADNALVLLRPPGHHAEKKHAMGFCVFNNSCVAVNSLRKKHKNLSRVAIVDWDVHHGNGVQNIFYDDPNVLYFSIHRSEYGTFYPGQGFAKDIGGRSARGFTVNIPCPCETHGDREFLEAWHVVLLPILSEFKPQLILVSAGFDACIGDPLGDYTVTPPCYGLMTHLLMQQCSKIVISLEGGYNTKTMPQAVAEVSKVLLTKKFDESSWKPFADVDTTSKELRKSQF